MRIAKLGKILLNVLLAAVILVLLAMLGVKIALDRAPRYQAEIKEWVHAQTGYHIRFAHVSPALRWYGPELYFEQLELRSKDDQRVLARAAGGRVAVDVWQLLSSGKLLAGRIEVDAPNILVVRLGPSRFALAGEVELGGGEGTHAALTLDDLPEGAIAIRRAQLTLQNWNTALPQLTLRNVSMDMRRGAHGVSLAFAAAMPPALGGTVSFSATANGPGDLSTLAWKALAEARGISFNGWRDLLPDYLGNLDSGSGAFQISAQGSGSMPESATVEFAAINVSTQLIYGPMARFDEMSGILNLVHSGDRWTLTGRRVRVGRGNPESAFDATWRETDAGLLDLSAHASYLRAETLLPLTGFLPQQGLRDRLRAIAPSGEWSNARLVMQRNTAADPWRLTVQAKFRNAGFAPVGGAPGLRGLNGSIAGTESGGELDIDSNAAVFAWPTQFPQPLDLQALRTRIYWQRNAGGLLVATPGLQMQTRDGSLSGQMAWSQPFDGSSPIMTLVGGIENGNMAAARNYLPKGLLAAPAYAWLSHAFVGGHMSHASLLLRGPVLHFPFRDGSGIFLARASFDAMTLDYGEGWPLAEDFAGSAEFRNEGMSARLLSGRLGTVTLESGDARFPDFRNGELSIHAATRGDVDNILSFLRATPLDADSEHAFSGVQASGALEAHIDLFFPFQEFSRRRVLVHGHLDGVSATRPGFKTMATEVAGDFDIDNGQVAHADITGQLLGGAFQMQARTPRGRPVTRTQLEFRGTMSAEAACAALSIPSGISITGQADWRAVVKITPDPARERSLRVSSTLAGFDIHLPAPLDKPAGTPLPSWFEIQWPAEGGPVGRLALGTLLHTNYELESDAQGMRLAHASLVFGSGDADVGDSQIFNVGGTIERLDLTGWLKINIPSDNNAKPLAYYMRSATLKVAELDYLGLAFRDLSLDLAVAEGSWRISVGGPNVIGAIVVPTAAGYTEPWSLKFDRLGVDVDVAGSDEATPSADDAAAGAGARAGANAGAVGAMAGVAGSGATAAGPATAVDSRFGNPRDIPAINFHATELNWGERHLGDVTATLTRLDDGISLKQLTVVGPTFNVSANGEWRGSGAGVARIEGTLTSSDVENTLKDLGYAEVIQAKSGKMDFDLSWPGAPTAEDLAQTTGHVQMSLEKGQVIGLKPGAGRVLGLASIAALPRRLSLDFSDLTDKGLAFDSVRGDFDLREGNAYTDNVLLKGPAAEIGLIGRVGLKNRDYDQTAVVTGNVGNSFTIPVASALVGGPVAGAVVLLFTQVFKQPLKGLARGYYRITGSWDNPIVERIKSAEAAAATAEAPK